MIRRTLSVALVLGLSAGAWAQVAPKPVPSNPALPAGHPAIPAPDGPSALPPGHPQTDTAPDPNALPAGHPDVSGMKKTIAHGSLSLHATQGTANGTNPAGDVVAIDFYSANPTPEHVEGKLDATGTLTVPDITIPGACQPLIKVTHAGVDYQGIGQVMDAAHPGEKVEVKVFDTTEQAPDWSMKMRHLIIHRSPAGLEVTEVLMLDSPGDRVWRGAGDPQGQRITMDLPLPPNAESVQLGDGFKQGGVAIKDGHILNGAPLIPGQTQLQFNYTVPVKDGNAEIAISSPVAVGHLMMFVPDDGSTVTGDGLIAAGSGNAGGGSMRFYMVPSMPAGKMLKIGFTKLAAPPAKAAADDTAPAPAPEAAAIPEPARKSSNLPVIVGIGGAVVLVGGTIVIFTRPAANKRA